MKKTLRICLLLMLSMVMVVSLLGCTPQAGDAPNANPDPADGNNGAVDNNNNKLIDYGDVSAKVLTEGYPAEIEQYLNDNKEKETQQALNVNNRTYIVLTMGEQSSAGYAIELKDLELADGTLKVSAKYIKPGKDDVVATVITYPSLVIETDDIYEGHYEIVYDIEK